MAKLTIFLTDRNQLGDYRTARDGAMGEAKCASSLVIVKALATPGMLAEVEAVAVKSYPSY